MDNYEINELTELDKDELTELDKDHLRDVLCEELPALRAKVGLSQDELSNIIGISRQTYNAIETKKSQMSWNTFLTLILLYGYNEKTATFVEEVGAFPPALKRTLNTNKRPQEIKKVRTENITCPGCGGVDNEYEGMPLVSSSGCYLHI